MTKPTLGKAWALFYVFQQLTNKEAAPILTQPQETICTANAYQPATIRGRKAVTKQMNLFITIVLIGKEADSVYSIYPFWIKIKKPICERQIGFFYLFVE